MISNNFSCQNFQEISKETYKEQKNDPAYETKKFPYSILFKNKDGDSPEKELPKNKYFSRLKTENFEKKAENFKVESRDETIACDITMMPAEVLQQIIFQLPLFDFMKAKAVCQNFKANVQALEKQKCAEESKKPALQNLEVIFHHFGNLAGPLDAFRPCELAFYLDDMGQLMAAGSPKSYLRKEEDGSFTLIIMEPNQFELDQAKFSKYTKVILKWNISETPGLDKIFQTEAQKQALENLKPMQANTIKNMLLLGNRMSETLHNFLDQDEGEIAMKGLALQMMRSARWNEALEKKKYTTQELLTGVQNIKPAESKEK